MKTVYLDKNIYSYFSKDVVDDLYSKLILELKNSRNFLTIYSYAHIEDLLQSKDHEKNLIDLMIIESLAKTNYCYYDNDLKKFCFAFYSPKEIYDCQDDTFGIIDSLFETMDFESLISDEMKASISKMKDDWIKANPVVGIDNKSLSIISSFFPTNMEKLSISEIFKESYKGLRAFNTDNSIYRSLRAYNYDNINKGQYTIDKSSNEISKDITESPFQKSLFDLVFSTLKQQNGEEVFRFDFHTLAYIMLDMLGFDRDTKVKTNNLYVDSHHSYYGAHFDYVVSNDNGFVTKSRALYKMLGIDSKVMFPGEFLQEINAIKLQEINNFRELLDNVVEICKNTSPVLEEKSEANVTYQYEPSSSYFCYFNNLIKRTYNDGTFEYILAKSQNKYLENRLPTKLISQLIDDCLDAFGKDLWDVGKLDIEKEMDNLKSKEGIILRAWHQEDHLVVLEMVNFKLFLTIAKLGQVKNLPELK